MASIACMPGRRRIRVRVRVKVRVRVRARVWARGVSRPGRRRRGRRRCTLRSPVVNTSSVMAVCARRVTPRTAVCGCTAAPRVRSRAHRATP
eukprot:scaffold138933_cov136-Phaeocystis_antarctica.AAC.1